MNSHSRSSSRLPDFLIIGAMKAGTTSLCADLQTHPEICIPSAKEPHFLTDDKILSSAGRRRYGRLFSRANKHQICGEASTGYAKLPTIQGVPSRARQLLGPQVKLIYMVRNPIERAISHHYHMVRADDLALPIDEAVRQVPELVDYGRYAMQLEPWLATFEASQLHVVRFENYISHRLETVSGIFRFLGVRSNTRLIDVESIHNQGQSVLTPRPLFKLIFRRVTQSRLYKVHIHPRTPRLRNTLRSLLMQSPPVRPPRPSKDSLRYLSECFQADAEQLRRLLNRNGPLWHLDQTIRVDAAEQPAVRCVAPFDQPTSRFSTGRIDA